MSRIDIETVASKVNEIIELLELQTKPLCLHDGDLKYPEYGGGGIYCKLCGDMVDEEEVYDD